MFFSSKLKKGLKKALANPTEAAAAILDVSGEPVANAGEAELVVKALGLFPLPSSADGETNVVGSPLHALVAFYQGAEGDAVIAVFKRGAAELVRVFDVALSSLRESERDFRVNSDLMFVLKVMALYAPEGGLERLRAAARAPALRDEYLWSVILDIVSRDGHPWQRDLVEALRDRLPEGFAGIAFLDLANTLARKGALARHPFDTDLGRSLLQGWLSDPDEAHASHAHSATASIPFVSDAARDGLLARAEAHADQGVRLEAAWAAAKCGMDRGLVTLRAACSDPRTASAAVRYLEELEAEAGLDLSIPILSDNFLAMAEMCQWLAHPQEFGRPPEVITQADTRELYWPPTNDRRRLWLFRYEYPPNDGETERDIGYGMVGSVTFALFGETTADKKPEEVYALHCAWELEINQDPRAPEERSVLAGLELLAQHNPEFKAFLPN